MPSEIELAVRSIPCPETGCDAEAGKPCRGSKGSRRFMSVAHFSRREAAIAAGVHPHYPNGPEVRD